MDFDKNDVIAGGLVLTALAFFLGVMIFVNHKRFTAETYPVKIHLTNIAGVEKGVDVVYKGYKAGSVDRVAIAYEPEFRFIVHLSIKSEIKLKRGTSVKVRNKGFGGAKDLELVPPKEGEEGTPVMADAVLPVVSDPDLMSKANEVLSKVENVVQDFQKAKTASQLNATIAEAKSVLTNLNKVLLNANALVTENRKSLKASLDQTHGITTKTNKMMQDNQAELKKIVTNLDRSLKHLPPIMSNLEEFTAEIKENPWRLIRKGKPKKKKKKKKD